MGDIDVYLGGLAVDGPEIGALDEVLEGPETDVVPSRMSGSLPPGPVPVSSSSEAG